MHALRRSAAETVWTIGHSTHPIDAFIALLTGHGVRTLVDVRRHAGSRKHPQFNPDALGASLAAAGLAYVPMPSLGGRRTARADSPNVAWRNASFRGYADYMQTPEFDAELRNLVELARTDRVALMCAEAVPWRCHRSLIADALTAHGVATCEIASPKRLQPHRLPPFACVHGETVTYPPPLDERQAP